MIDWHFPRDELAKRYMDAFGTGITGALALFAPRKYGKTEFILADLAPEAENRGYYVCYCSFWNLQDNPAKALRIALEELKKGSGLKGRWSEYAEGVSGELSATVAGAGLKVKRGVSKTEEDDLLAIIDLLRAAGRRKKPTLLLLDEVQHLANKQYGSLVATMRTQLDEHREKIHVVFTGSSRDGLQRMFRDRKAPMFHSAQQVDFPQLESSFVAFMLKAFEQASQKKLPLGKATQVFNQIDHNPALFHQLLRHMVIKGIWNIEKGFDDFNKLVDVDADFESVWNAINATDRAVLKCLVTLDEKGLYSDEARLLIADDVGVAEVSVRTVQLAMDRLRAEQIVHSPSRGVWLFEDPNFREWVIDTGSAE